MHDSRCWTGVVIDLHCVTKIVFKNNGAIKNKMKIYTMHYEFLRPFRTNAQLFDNDIPMARQKFSYNFIKLTIKLRSQVAIAYFRQKSWTTASHSSTQFCVNPLLYHADAQKRRLPAICTYWFNSWEYVRYIETTERERPANMGCCHATGSRRS